MTTIKKILISFVTIALLSALAYDYFNNVFYGHFHVLANGEIVHHAHPFDKGDDDSGPVGHSHTENEIRFYYMLVKDLFFISAIISFSMCIRNWTYIPKIFFSDFLLLGRTHHYFHLRAPPVF